MNEDMKANKSEGYCDNCGEPLCKNCGNCCDCKSCICSVCHPKEKDNEPEVKEPINYS
jgi:hypothetical protein